MKKLLATLFATMALVSASAGCKPTSVTPNGGEDCKAACVQARALGKLADCEDVARLADPTPSGTPCETWRCRQTIPPARNACIAKASVCDDARRCASVVE